MKLYVKKLEKGIKPRFIELEAAISEYKSYLEDKGLIFDLFNEKKGFQGWLNEEEI